MLTTSFPVLLSMFRAFSATTFHLLIEGPALKNYQLETASLALARYLNRNLLRPQTIHRIHHRRPNGLVTDRQQSNTNRSEYR